MSADLTLNLFSGPGGWCVAAAELGIDPNLGLELDAAACDTRRAAGHLTVRCDVAAFDVAPLAGKVRGLVGSPPCVTFSAAGKRGGVALTDILDALIRDLLEGSATRAAHRREMARMLRMSWWPSPKLTKAQRQAKIWQAVRSASLVAEPARFIHACDPEWVALEQVPSVLPLWEVYADELRKRGYSAWCGLLNSADYGVPQTRVRAILIASKVRKISRPAPTHYDPRKGYQLFGTPWRSMADALGWAATDRPAPTITAGGTSAGGAEPFGTGGRNSLAAERDAGRWALRMGNQPNAAIRPAPAPAPTIAFGHNTSSMQWVNLRRTRGATEERPDHPADEPAPTITSAGGKAGANLEWVLHTNRDQRPDGTRQTADPEAGPAPSVTAKSGGQWVLTRQVGKDRAAGRRDHPLDEPAPTITGGGSAAGSGNGAGLEWKFRNNNNNNNSCSRSLDEPAGTLFFGRRSNWAAWTLERPATTVQGDPRVAAPHKEHEPRFNAESVRISVQEAAILQSFPADYPWAGSKTKQFEQVGNAVPPLLALHVLAMATGLPLPAWIEAAA